MIDRYPSSPPGSRNDHEHALVTLGPWHEAAELPLEPLLPPCAENKPSKPSKPSTRLQGVNRTNASLSSRTPLPQLDLGRVRMQSSSGLDASPVTDAYRALVEQTGAMELALSQRSEARREAAAALRAGAENLSPALVDAQKRLLRLQALQNEVAIFQQHLDPFIFEIRSAREHEVRSSVYRHFARMRAVQDMGVPIYGIGAYALEPTDKVLVPRAAHRVYRRIRRRDAMHFIDTDLIPRPAVVRRQRTEDKET